MLVQARFEEGNLLPQGHQRENEGLHTHRGGAPILETDFFGAQEFVHGGSMR